MFLLLKISKIAFKLLALGLLLFIGYLAYEFKINKASEVDLGLVAVVSYNDSYKVTLRKEEGGYIKFLADKLSDMLYQEATEHNPKGDIIPDSIDNTVKEKVKETLENGETKP